MPCKAVNCSATLLFMGVASQVCGGGDGSVPEVLFNIWLDPNAFKLCSKLKQCYDAVCTNAYGTKDTHYWNKWTQTMRNELSGGGDAYGVAWGKEPCGVVDSGERLTDWLGQNGLFYRKVWRHHSMHACDHEDVTTHRHGTQDYNRGQWVPEGHLPHTLG